MKKAAYVPLVFIFLAISCGGPARYVVELPKPLPRKTAQKLLSQAHHHLGEPYRYGGASSKGWDCSGFVNYIYYKSTGITLPRSAHDIFLNCARLPYSYGRPGDLIFFKKRDSHKAAHVGIYIGHGDFVHVSTSSGVIVSSLDEPYFKKAFIGIGRPRIEKIARR